MEFKFLKVGITNGVGWLEYNKPPVNAISVAMMREIVGGLQQLAADPAARVMVIASALPSHFSAGAELGFFAVMTPQEMSETADIAHQMLLAVREAPKPVLAAIHGTAVGGGLELTLHADVRFAATDARLGQPEIAIGFVPAIGAMQALVRLMGRARTIRYLYEGRLVSAQEAQAMGMVDLLHPPERLHAEVQAYAEALAQKPPEALEAIRKTVNEGMELPFLNGIQYEKDWIVRLVGTRNFREGVSAFLAKRKPEWSWD